MNPSSSLSVQLLPLIITLILPTLIFSYHDYADALSKSILFFEGQRSGSLPQDQRMWWRANSGLSDGSGPVIGSRENIELTGGYYDAGDNVKFNFPMAFTTTMLAWSVIEFGELMPPSEKRNSLIAIRWAADYLLKSVSLLPNRIYVQVGDPIDDHNCWERPEDMDTKRTVYAVESPNPASDVAGEIAAALAATSMVFKLYDPGFAETLLRSAVNAFRYADTYRGAYSDNQDIRGGVCPFYCDFDGYQDELLWGAAWLRRATEDESYLTYIESNGQTLGASDNTNEFGWDNKHAGLNVLVSKEALETNILTLQSYRSSAETFICPSTSTTYLTNYTPGGLIYKPGGSNLQHATTISFLLLVYANYLETTSHSLNCVPTTTVVTPTSLRRAAQRQTNYILGENPMGMSYMVGYSSKFPLRIHHRGSSLPSIKIHPESIRCKEGSVYYNSTEPNVNVLIGAVVGGPGEDDLYEDDRGDFRKSEPTTYINAPFVGVLAYFVAYPDQL